MRSGGVKAAIVCAACVLAAGRAHAGTVLAFDEVGDGLVNGTPIPWYLSNDPGPGGEANVLTYALPFAGVQGDLVLTDPNFSDLPMEIIRFNGDGTLIYYAGNVPGLPAYVAAPPGAFYDNVAVVSDTAAPEISSAMYTPVDGQPGFDASQPTYLFVNAAPEPGSWMLVSMIAVLCMRRGRRR